MLDGFFFSRNDVGTPFATMICDYRVKQSEKKKNPKTN
jgi:hypothetical protein